MALKKAKVEMKVVIVLLLLSFIAGYLWKVIQGNEGHVSMRSSMRHKSSARQAKVKRSKRYF